MEDIAADERLALQRQLESADAHVQQGQRVRGAEARAESEAAKAAAHSAQLGFASFVANGGGAPSAAKPRKPKPASEAPSNNKLDSLKANEEHAKRRIAELQRQLDQTRIKARLSEVERRNLAVGDAIRAHARNDRLKNLLEGAAAASDEEMRELSAAFNGRMCELLEAGHAVSPSAESWTKLFRLIDADASGQISFDEMCRMTREELQLLPADMADASLKAVWLALDKDRSGYISAGEFGHFMRLGVDVLVKHKGSWRERLEARNRLAAESLRAKKDRMLEKDLARRLEGVSAAPEGDVALLARLCHGRLSQVNDEDEKTSRSWFNLFKRVDADDSGRVTFAEFRRLVRVELGVEAAALEDVKLKGVWLALDRDQNGFITAGEFGAFMRRAEPQGHDRRLRMLLARRRRAAATREHDEKVKSEAKQHREETTQRKRESVREMREETARRTAHDKLEREAANKAHAATIRAISNQDALRTALADQAAASESDVQALADACNHRMLDLVDRDPTRAAWFKFYRRVDSDGSGRICFAEFSHMLRQELLLQPSDMSDDALKAAWVALDVDQSGYISAGEFGHFMRKGEHVLENAMPHGPWKQRRVERAKAAHAARQLEKDKLFHKDIAREMAGAASASDEDVKRLSEHFNARLAELEDAKEDARQATGGGSSSSPAAAAPTALLCEMSTSAAAASAVAAVPPIEPPQKTSMWYSLFKHVDENDSGTIGFEELRAIVRRELQLPPSNVPEAVLKAVWIALDKDGSGFISAGEFGHFMRLGAPSRQEGFKRSSVLERKKLLAQRERAIFEVQAARVQHAHAQRLERRNHEYERRVQALEADLYAELSGGSAGGAPGLPDPARTAVEPLPTAEELRRQRALTMASLRGKPPEKGANAPNKLAAYASKSTPVLTAAPRGKGKGGGAAASEGKLLKLPAIS